MSRPLVAKGALWLAKLACLASLFLLPWRWQGLLQARPAPPIYSDFSNLIIYAHEYLLLLTLILWGISLVVGRPLPKLLAGPLLLTVPITALTALSFFTAIAATDPILAFYQAGRIAAHLGLYFFVINSGLDWSRIVASLGSGLLLQGGLGLVQVWQQADVGLQTLGERTLDISTASIAWAPEGLQTLRAYGLTDHPNILGMHLALGLILLVGWLRRKQSDWVPAALLTVALGVAALFLTFYQPSWTAFALGLLVLSWLDQRNRNGEPALKWAPLLISSFLITLPLFWLFRPYVQLGYRHFDVESHLAEQTRQRQERQALAELTNRLFAEQAAFGVGAGNLPLAMREAESNFSFNYQPPFNTILTVAAELGMFGSLFYLLALMAPWLTLILQRQRLRWTPLLVTSYALLAALIFLGLTDAFPWAFAAGRYWQLLAWSLWGLAYVTARAQSAHSSQRQ